MAAACRWLAALVLVALAAGQAVVEDAVSDVQGSTCSCDCCEVAARTPAEIVGGSTPVKCVPANVDLTTNATETLDTAQTGKRNCDANCVIPPDGAQVISNTKTSTCLTSQFCFLECKPFGLEIGTACVKLSDQEAAKARTQDGSGEDIHALPKLMEPPTVPPRPAEIDADFGASPKLEILKPKEEEKKKAPEAEEALKKKSASVKKASDIQKKIDKMAEEATKHADSSEERAQKVGKKLSGWKPADGVKKAGGTPPGLVAKKTQVEHRSFLQRWESFLY
eukprot:gnl/TRDRNA2_/TRDRNA2_181710_c0_seq1.p1 gnl/TRDRNA2_/TRDRNA2_181710_c0~~gnl/TRDRNA2_/TRDRNA2_181710_c0_seq1.p1  ORF type:complete len:280 (-),score=75.03 gnl/TRDRNA2_/TRDRNA2_181710_c0_seq1:85-924(-)